LLREAVGLIGGPAPGAQSGRAESNSVKSPVETPIRADPQSGIPQAAAENHSKSE